MDNENVIFLKIFKLNKHCYMDFMTMLKFRDGKIIEKRAKYDRVFIYQQLGVENLNLKI